MEPLFNPRIWEDAMIKRLTPEERFAKTLRSTLEWQYEKMKESLNPIQLFIYERVRNERVRKFIMRKYRVESNSQGIKIFKHGELMTHLIYEGGTVVFKK
jgi:hypothetical protein